MENLDSDHAKKIAEHTLQLKAQEQASAASRNNNEMTASAENRASTEAMQSVVHQLQVHQIELEMQNDELRRTQFELETAKLRYFDLYDLAPVGYCTLSESGLIVEANLMAATLFDTSRADLVNKPISQFISDCDQDIYYLHHNKLISSGEPISCELRIRNGDGKIIWVNLNATFEKNLEGVPFIRKVIIDISARKHAELALIAAEEHYHSEQNRLDDILKNANINLIRATVAAEKASSVAEQANRAKSDFLSNMSHELRTPLGTILGFAQLIDSGVPPPTATQKRSVDQILRAGWYLLELINEILDLALIESGKISITLEPVELMQVLRDCQSMIEPQAKKHDIKIIFAQISAPFVVWADATRLKQVLINLLSNAVKYNRPGGTVVVSCTQSTGRIRICIKDSGQGLTSELIAQLFQPFNRLGQENKGEEGTGIGLVMTKRLIELMGGEIGLESVVGEGSTFWVDIELLPKTNATPTEIKPTSKPVEHPVHGESGLYTLLYVEDNPANLLLLESIIERRLDIQLLTALDATSGIELARVAQPNIILMDINLPGISGTHALKALKEQTSTVHIPVIALSANAIPADIKSGLAAGFFQYLTKPIKIDELMSAIDAALQVVKDED